MQPDVNTFDLTPTNVIIKVENSSKRYFAMMNNELNFFLERKAQYAVFPVRTGYSSIVWDAPLYGFE